MTKVLFLPDWRSGNSYQQLLSEGLREFGVEVEFPIGYRRGLPVTRLCRESNADLIHLHWPEAYFSSGGVPFRTLRFPVDLAFAAASRPLVYTAHNLLPHNCEASWPVCRAYRQVLRISRAVFVHSNAAAHELMKTFALPALPVTTIPHGDLSADSPQPIAANDARRLLSLPDAPLCLIFGAVEPYKGIDTILRWWHASRPNAMLAIVGKPNSPGYSDRLRHAAENDDSVMLHLDWLPAEQLLWWLSAADVVVFNYVRSLTSGAAALARSLGIPVLLPQRLATIELGEPNPRVFRFHDSRESFVASLVRALAMGADYGSAADWRDSTSWSQVARLTADIYRRVLSSKRCPASMPVERPVEANPRNLCAE